jgi:hypothetical protein
LLQQSISSLADQARRADRCEINNLWVLRDSFQTLTPSSGSAEEVAISGNPSLFDHLPIGPRSEDELDGYVQARLEHKTFEKVGGTVALVVETAVEGEYAGSMQLSTTVVEPLQLQIGWIALPQQITLKISTPNSLVTVLIL